MPGIQQELNTYLWMDLARAAAHTHQAGLHIAVTAVCSHNLLPRVCLQHPFIRTVTSLRKVKIEIESR